MSENKLNRPLAEQDKQFLPMPGEIDPKEAKVKVFLAMQKAKQRLSKNRR